MRCSTGEAEVAIRHVRQRVAHEEATEALDPTVLDQRVRERRKVVAAVAFCTRKRGGGERLQAQPECSRRMGREHATYGMERTAAAQPHRSNVAEHVSRYAACCMLHRLP